MSLQKRLSILELAVEPEEDRRKKVERWANALIAICSTMRREDAERVITEIGAFRARKRYDYSLITGEVWRQVNAAAGIGPSCLRMPPALSDLWIKHEASADARYKTDVQRCVSCHAGHPYFKEKSAPGGCVMDDGTWNIPPIPEFRYTDDCLLCGGALVDSFNHRWGRAA